MLISSRLRKFRGLLCVTRAFKLQTWSVRHCCQNDRFGIRLLSLVSEPNSSNLQKFPRRQTSQVLSRLVHCSSCQSVKNSMSNYQKNGSSDSHEFDFNSDPQIRSWMNELNSDFGHEKNNSTPGTENSSFGEALSSDDSGNSSDIESAGGSSSDSDESDFESSHTVKSSEVEEIDYEEFFLEEEAIRHEDLIEQVPIPIDLNRGQAGVFDVDEIVQVLEEENGVDICVIPVPPEINYTDNLIIVTGRSFRHLLGMAELIRWIYKRKRGDKDPVTVRIEGLQSKDWLALDLGNIVLHLMMEKVRKKYDIESLWLMGPENDPLSQETEHNPYVLTPQMEKGESFKSEQPSGDLSAARDKQPELHSMQSVTGWHRETQEYKEPENLPGKFKKSDDPGTKES